MINRTLKRLVVEPRDPLPSVGVHDVNWLLIRASGVRHVVFLSSVGADMPEGLQMGISQNVAGLYAEMARAFTRGACGSRAG